MTDEITGSKINKRNRCPKHSVKL